MELVTGYGAMARRLWTTLPTVQFSHTVISTLVAMKILCKCPPACFPVLCAWLYGSAQHWDCNGCWGCCVIQESTSESALGIISILVFFFARRFLLGKMNGLVYRAVNCQGRGCGPPPVPSGKGECMITGLWFDHVCITCRHFYMESHHPFSYTAGHFSLHL
jgi:hypothetical protein